MLLSTEVDNESAEFRITADIELETSCCCLLRGDAEDADDGICADDVFWRILSNFDDDGDFKEDAEDIDRGLLVVFSGRLGDAKTESDIGSSSVPSPLAS